jgi:hypothetical protein
MHSTRASSAARLRSIAEPGCPCDGTGDAAPRSGATYQQFEFPRNLGYAHDLIDPNGLNGKSIDAIYGALYPYLGIPAPAQ